MARKPESIWGYIEGYYGRLFGWDEREALIGHLARSRAGRASADAQQQKLRPKRPYGCARPCHHRGGAG